MLCEEFKDASKRNFNHSLTDNELEEFMRDYYIKSCLLDKNSIYNVVSANMSRLSIFLFLSLSKQQQQQNKPAISYPEPTRLVNLKNPLQVLCYMDSVVLFLFNIPAFRNLVLQTKSNSPVVKALVEVFKKLQNGCCEADLQELLRVTRAVDAGS